MPDTSPPASEVPAWHVVSQAEGSQINAQGRPEQTVIVTFALADGTQGTVIIPRSRYTLDNVRQAVDAQAALLAAVNNLHA